MTSYLYNDGRNHDMRSYSLREAAEAVAAAIPQGAPDKLRAERAEPKRRGRPPLPDDRRQTERVEIRMTAEQRLKLEHLGGAKWLRERIDNARLTSPLRT